MYQQPDVAAPVSVSRADPRGRKFSGRQPCHQADLSQLDLALHREGRTDRRPERVCAPITGRERQVRMVRTRCAAIAAAALIATVAVTACGSAGVSVTGGTPSGAITNPSEVRGGTLRFANSGDWDSLDPADTYFTDAWDFARLLRPLARHVQAGTTGHRDLLPARVLLPAPRGARRCGPTELARPGSPTGGAGLTEAAHHHTLIRDFSKGESGVYCVL